MTDRRPDPVDDLLSGLAVPPLSAGFADRVVAEARRAGRVPAPALVRSRRPRPRRWTRRGAWTTVLAINLMLASAVAAALGSGAVNGPHLIAAARHVVERLTHRADVVPPHRAPTHPRPHVLVNSSREHTPRQPAVVPAPLAPPTPAVRRLVEERLQPVPRIHPRGEASRLARPTRVEAAKSALRPTRHQSSEAREAARRFGDAGRPFQRRRFTQGAGRRFGDPGLYGPRFGGARAGPPPFRAGPRFGGGGPRRGGFRRGWRGRRGWPRRRF